MQHEHSESAQEWRIALCIIYKSDKQQHTLCGNSVGSDPVGFGGMAVAADRTAVLWVNHKAAAVHTHLITIVGERLSPPVFTHRPTVFKKPETYVCVYIYIYLVNMKLVTETDHVRK